MRGPLVSAVCLVLAGGLLPLADSHATVCDLPDKIGVEHPLVAGRGASLAWNGNGFGLAWEQPTIHAFFYGIFFLRLDAAGRPVGEPVQITQQWSSVGPSLVWNGTGYGLAWKEYRTPGGDVTFARLDEGGQLLGEPRHVTEGVDSMYRNPRLVWNGDGYGVLWNERTDVWLSRLDAEGNTLGRSEIGDHRGLIESLVWTGDRYAALWRLSGVVYFRLVGASGTPLGSSRELATVSPPEPNYVNDDRYAALVWTGDGFGAVMQLCGPVDCETTFRYLTETGLPYNPRSVAQERLDGLDLAWTGSEWGLVWQTASGTWIRRLSLLGEKIGDDVRITDGAAWQRAPRLVWHDGEFGLTIEPSQVPAGSSVWFARIGCCLDSDGDGFASCAGDCDDHAVTVYPGAPELCDGVPNDCGNPEWPTLPLDESDADGDGVRVCAGDCADTDATRHPGATEICNGLDDDCDALVDEDAAGTDSDADGIRNACDNCRFLVNPAQSDGDGDGQGDDCDVDDGWIQVRFEEPAWVAWDPEIGWVAWNVYRGDLDFLKTTGEYTQAPGENELAARECDLLSTWVADSPTLPPGAVAFYLVSGTVSGVEGDLGTDSSGAPRPNTHPCE